MYLNEMKTKGIFRTKIILSDAFCADPEKSDVAKKARKEIELAKLNIQTIPDGADPKLFSDAKEKLKTWETMLSDTTAAMLEENERLVEYAAIYEGAWILLREPREEELLRFETGEKNQTAMKYTDLFPDCIIDWNIMRDENEKASKDEVMALLKQSSTLYFYCINAWGLSLPLARKSGRASIAPLAQSSGVRT